MKSIRSTIDHLREKYAPVKHTSTFRSTGQITPEEFVAAGDFLVYKFPSWSWSDAAEPSRRVNYLPDGKQFLVTRGVPCHRRLEDGDFAGTAQDVVVRDAEAKDGDGEDEGWLQTGGNQGARKADERDVRTIDGSGNVGPQEEEDEIPDMEDDEDDEEAIIREKKDDSSSTPTRTYTLYITYSTFYSTPRFYLSGYTSTSSTPLPPEAMMSDIVGDYADKTVTLEDFPFFDPATSIKMASVHPCRHASVMKTLLERADAAMKLRRERVKQGKEPAGTEKGMEGLVDETEKLKINAGQAHKAGVSAAGGNGGDEWEVLQHEGEDGDEESAIRVDQYLVVFLKFLATMTPSIEHDYTMGV